MHKKGMEIRAHTGVSAWEKKCLYWFVIFYWIQQKLPNEEEKVLGDDQSDFMTALTFHVGHLHLSQLFMVS